MTDNQKKKVLNIEALALAGKNFLDRSGKKWEPTECFLKILRECQELRTDWEEAGPIE